jgi:hypothetical protein
MLMNQGYPTYSKAAQKGDKGVEIVSRIINDGYGWLFKRNHQEHDFGIDAQVDVILDDGSVTGQMIALQIKYGASFFKEKESSPKLVGILQSSPVVVKLPSLMFPA